MKIVTRTSTYEKVTARKTMKHRLPLRPSFLLNTVIRLISLPDLMATKFRHTSEGMEKIKGQPSLILMNHSSFIDLKIANRIFYPKVHGIVCTSDGFVGKGWLMRWLGCIPTQKYVSDLSLIKDMEYMLKVKKCNVLMYPEAGYSFDGTATTLPRKLGILLKKLDVPVVTVITQGAFSRDPLYNGLQLRKVPVSAHVKCLLTRDEVREKSVKELDALVDEAFTFDAFAWQKENGIRIREKFRADGLERILYKCPACGAERQLEGKGIHLTCHSCGKQWELEELGQLRALDGETEYPHIPDWYAWQRSEVRRELEEGTYQMESKVRIGMLVDHSALYMVGEGVLTHGPEGFCLTGGDGKLSYTQPPLACHSANSDYFWYEIGDVIGIGNREALYYCFPENVSVTKVRLAAEELYKLKKQRRSGKSEA